MHDSVSATILVVDDEPEIVLLASVALGMAGYHVRQAANGPEALRVCQQARIDLVLTDVKMPGMSGIELANLLRAVAPGIRVIYMSGFVGDENCPSGYLAKPFHLADLQRTVAAALDA